MAVAQARSVNAPGHIQSFHVDAVTPAFAGRVPPAAHGAYELIRATVTGTLDPRAPGNAGIVDLALAPRDRQGRVHYRSNVLILRPVHADDASRVLIYDVANRGSLLGRQTFIGGGKLSDGMPPDSDFPSWLEHGYTVVWSGWQGDIPLSADGRIMGTQFPLARIHGHPVTGMSREEYIPDTSSGPAHTFRLSYPPAQPGARTSVTFTARESWLDASGRETYAAPSVPVRTWHYTLLHGHPAVAFEPPAYVPGPHGKPMPPDAGTIYSFVYRATQSRVDGIGFAAVRDLMHFLRSERDDATGHANPLADMVAARCAKRACPARPVDYADTVIAVGMSQSGRFLRDFLYRGFNDAGDGHRVFDGMMPIIAGARRTWVDTRFAQPGRWSKQHEDHFMRGFRFPFAYNVLTDPLGTRRDGLLKACTASRTCPKIMQVDGSFEWWNGAASLVVTDGAGHDLHLPDNVRYYLIPGTGHGGGPGVDPGHLSHRKAAMCQFPDSPVAEAPYERALFAALVRWITRDTPPPASQYPTVADGTAVPADRVAFPSPGRIHVAAVGPHRAVGALPVFAARYNQVSLTRYRHAVPEVEVEHRYRILEPQVDRSGNEIAGIRTASVSVPLASYTGWNLRAAGHAEGELCDAHGAMLMLPSGHDANHDIDSRPTLAQLYPRPSDYRRKVDAAVQALLRKGLLLKADADAIEARAAAGQTAAGRHP